MPNFNSDNSLREVLREIRKRKAFSVGSLVILYPIWIWPFALVILMLLLKEIPPGMPLQDEHLVRARNAFLDLFFLQAFPSIFDAYVDAEMYYQLAGRPDLVRRVEVIGGILIGWGFLAKFYALFIFPTLLIKQVKNRNQALVMIFAFLIYAFLPFFLLILLT